MCKALLLTLLAAISLQVVAEQIVMPETITKIQLSNRDVNRLICTDGAMNDLVTSQEKGVAITHNGQSSFIKFLIMETGNQREYVTVRTEFYAVCNGVVYTLMVKPANIPGQTIRLGSDRRQQLDDNIELMSPLADEERAVFITLRAYHDNLPDSFTVSQSPQSRWDAFKDPEGRVTYVRKRRTVRVEGTGLSLTEYLVRPDQPGIYKESQFLSTYFGNNIFSVTLDPLELRPERSGRLFIVTREAPL